VTAAGATAVGITVAAHQPEANLDKQKEVVTVEVIRERYLGLT